MNESTSPETPDYSLNRSGQFIIADYNSKHTFSSFLPGIAGIDGMPMWVFYVNRGQGVCSMGTQDKNHAIMEYLPANRAYELVGRQGFRTFIKFDEKNNSRFYEPFQDYYGDRHLEKSQRMIITPAELSIEEINLSLKLKFAVNYFTVPNDRFPGLVRTLKIENLGTANISLTGLDGLPMIVPYGVDDFCLKNMRRTIEAFVEVTNLENKAPFFKAKIEPSDSPVFNRFERGNFYLGFETTGSETRLLEPIVDPTMIFGSYTDLSTPRRFIETATDDLPGNQRTENQLPSAMGLFRTTIDPGEVVSFSSIIGHASSQDKLNQIVSRVASNEYIESASRDNRGLIEKLTAKNFVGSSEPALDYYTQQNFLDNCMRGGLPITINGDDKKSVIYLYSRKHGDLERDYNDFRLMPTMFSQGNGNFRDINQNRRSDLFFNPDIGAANIEHFYNLIQLDGFNPLVLKEVRFVPGKDGSIETLLANYVAAEHIPKVATFVSEPFTPGELSTLLSDGEIVQSDELIGIVSQILSRCEQLPEADHGEGFWIDHWTYNLDLLENYLSVYPDKFSRLMFETGRFTFYDSAYYVQPRSERYVLRDNKAVQLGSVLLDEEKERLITGRPRRANQMRSDHGRGEVFRTSLIVKILCLLANKLATLDPEGKGVEMEAGKPSWYDALNGLPSLFGSSLCETLEIKRHISFLLEVFEQYELESGTIEIFDELKELIDALSDLFRRKLSGFEYWSKANEAKENYRRITRLGINGSQTTVEMSQIIDFLSDARTKLDSGLTDALEPKSKIPYTYFRHEITNHELVETVSSNSSDETREDSEPLPRIIPKIIKQIPLPLFLEGPVHYLRFLNDIDKAKALAARVRRSPLFDKHLKMYKVNESLADQPLEIGRARVFSPGWLENESIWLHMEYKYMLELLRCGLHQEFFEDFKNVFVPFMNPENYGRSILENSSFIASSAYPDSSIHGKGFVARLSGATAEFIHILMLMSLGPRPFRLASSGELQFSLEPVLPEFLFTKEARRIRLPLGEKWQEYEIPTNTFSFVFLGEILVTYHNPERKDTFGAESVRPQVWKLVDSDGRIEEIKGVSVEGDIARHIRNRNITKIDIILR